MIREVKDTWAFVANVSCRVSYGFTLKIDDYFVSRENLGIRGSRWRCGHLLGAGALLRMLTRSNSHNRDQPSDEVIDLMEGTVEIIANILDTARESMEEEIERRVELRIGHRIREFERYNTKDHEQETTDNLKEERQKWLYLFRHTNGLTKIGFSGNPSQRERTMQAEDPRVHMLATRPGKLYQEKRLHRIYEDKRVRGEWFDLSDQDVERLMLICGFSASTFN
jgi:hypothetical protein